MAHWLDRLYVRLTRQGSFFGHGWGDEARMAALAARPFSPPERSVALAWSAPRQVGDALVRDVTFESPLAAELPAESRVAHVRWLAPRGPTRAVCVLLAATGDEGFARRTRWASPLIREGVGVMMLENPLYGARRPRGQRGVDLRTVLDLLLLGRAAVEEACVLARWLHEQGHVVAVSGYSMGGQLAAMTGALLPFEVALVPAASPSSATAVFVDGLLARATAWPALGGDHPRTRARLARLLDGVALSTLPVPRAPRAAILMGARADGYVAPHHVSALHRHWPGAELRWMPGGHVTGYVGGAGAIRRGVLDALDRLAAER